MKYRDCFDDNTLLNQLEIYNLEFDVNDREFQMRILDVYNTLIDEIVKLKELVEINNVESYDNGFYDAVDNMTRDFDVTLAGTDFDDTVIELIDDVISKYK